MTVRILLLLLIALTTGPSLAQSSADFASGCADDSGGDRCSAAAVKAWNETYGLQPIEQMAADGAFVRRVLYVNGYGHNVIAISAVRAPGAPPIIEIRRPRTKKDPPVIRSRPISEATWDRIVTDAATAHRQYRPERDANGDKLKLCLHANVSRFEAAEPRRLAQYVIAQRWENSETRALTASACGAGPTEEFAARLAETAAASFGECSTLKIANQSSWAALLKACLGLSGDTVAAGRAFNVAEDTLDYLMAESSKAGVSWTDALRKDVSLASESLKANTRIDWSGLRTLFAGSNRPYYGISEIHGIDSQQVRMTGTLRWSILRPGGELQEPDEQSRTLQILWVLQTGNWVITDIELIG
jgi:hypothetical protein